MLINILIKIGNKTLISVFVLCRRGNDSQKAVQILKRSNSEILIQDVIGGLHSWAQKIDPLFPVY